MNWISRRRRSVMWPMKTASAASTTSTSRSSASSSSWSSGEFAELLHPAIDAHDQAGRSIRVVDRLDGRVHLDQGAIAALGEGPGLAGRLGGTTLDLRPKLGGRPTFHRRVEDIDLPDPALDAVLAKQVVEEQEPGSHPEARVGVREPGVPQPDVDPLTRVVPAGDRAVRIEVDRGAAHLHPTERARLTRCVVLPDGDRRAGRTASQSSARARTAGSPSGVTTRACSDEEPLGELPRQSLVDRARPGG